MMTVLEDLRRVRAVPVLRSPSAEAAIEDGSELVEGGMTVIELTYSTPGVLDAIRELSGRPGVVVGAGTVLTERQGLDAIDAGARFLVSPVWLPWLPALADDHGVPAIPGAATPSEIWQAHEAGAVAVKVFPIARLGGVDYIRDILAPLPGLQLMATGGVTARTAPELLAAGCLAVGVGTVRSDADRPGDPLRARARRFLDALG